MLIPKRDQPSFTSRTYFSGRFRQNLHAARFLVRRGADAPRAARATCVLIGPQIILASTAGFLIFSFPILEEQKDFGESGP